MLITVSFPSLLICVAVPNMNSVNVPVSCDLPSVLSATDTMGDCSRFYTQVRRRGVRKIVMYECIGLQVLELYQQVSYIVRCSETPKLVAKCFTSSF